MQNVNTALETNLTYTAENTFKSQPWLLLKNPQVIGELQIMADELMQEPTLESAPAAPETSSAVVGETNEQVQAETTAPAPDSQPEAAPTETPETEDWNGNDVEKLPKPLQARARGMLRHLHKVTQEAASVKQAAQAYQELTNHPEFQEYLQWKESRLNSQPQQAPQAQGPLISEDEFLEAQIDPAKFASVQQKLLMEQAKPFLNELQQVKKELATFKQEKVREKAASQLEAFGQSHPDFWKINPIIMKGALEKVVQKEGGSVEEAYNYAKSLEKQFLEQAQSTLKQQIEAKKKAVTASPSKSMEPEVVYVADKREANRVAFENAKLGKRVDVRVKGK